MLTSAWLVPQLTCPGGQAWQREAEKEGDVSVYLVVTDSLPASLSFRGQCIAVKARLWNCLYYVKLQQQQKKENKNVYCIGNILPKNIEKKILYTVV